MRLLSVLSVALAAQGTVASTWFGSAPYTNWDSVGLRLWLNDHDIPVPSTATHTDLQKLVEENWNSYVVSPYEKWDTDRLQRYLKDAGLEAEKEGAEAKDTLLEQVRNSWYETESEAQSAWHNVRDWIFDTWSDSQLKAFCDKHSIPVPQPRKRDQLLQQARENYEAVAQKSEETAAYPGNWLYRTWSESDLKEWLDTHGIPAPQPTTRDKLVASVRRNSRIAHLRAQRDTKKAWETVTDASLNTWDESRLQKFCDDHGISVPHGSRVTELRALIRKRRTEALNSGSKTLEAATTSAGNEYARATNNVREFFDEAVDQWSEARLKGYLEARNIQYDAKQNVKELRKLVKKNADVAVKKWDSWSFESFTPEQLREYIRATGSKEGQKIADKATATRQELTDQAYSLYSSMAAAGGQGYESVVNFLNKLTPNLDRRPVFTTWSQDDLRNYLATYGVPVRRESTLEEMQRKAREQYTYLRYGTVIPPSNGLYNKLSDTMSDVYKWVAQQFNQAEKKAAEATDAVREEL